MLNLTRNELPCFSMLCKSSVCFRAISAWFPAANFPFLLKYFYVGTIYALQTNQRASSVEWVLASVISYLAWSVQNMCGCCVLIIRDVRLRDSLGVLSFQVSFHQSQTQTNKQLRLWSFANPSQHFRGIIVPKIVRFYQFWRQLSRQTPIRPNLKHIYQLCVGGLFPRSPTRINLFLLNILPDINISAAFKNFEICVNIRTMNKTTSFTKQNKWKEKYYILLLLLTVAVDNKNKRSEIVKGEWEKTSSNHPPTRSKHIYPIS